MLQQSQNLSHSSAHHSMIGEESGKNEETMNVYGFEKNYPKNIFIPIIQYLAELGFKQLYEKSVGTRQNYESKNVVSLSTLYQLITQPWFVQNINKQILVSNISNKILLNSKIKKKIFHIKIVTVILFTNAPNCHSFRSIVSKQSYNISSMNRSNQLHDDLFNYSNACIYLLHLFLRTLTDHLSLKSIVKLFRDDKYKDFQSNEEKAGSLDSIRDQYKQYCHRQTQLCREKGSKDEYKFLTKQIVTIFSKKSICFDSLENAFNYCSQAVLKRAAQIQNKYQLNENVPNWNHFITSIIENCFKRKRNEMKVTNSIFNDWITQFKSKSISIQDQSGRNLLTNLILINNFSKMRINTSSKKWYGAKQFSPIIISKIVAEEPDLTKKEVTD